MKARYPSLVLLCLALCTPAAHAQALGMTPTEQQEVQRLIALPDVSVRFDDAPLEDVLRTLAEASDMAYIGLPRPKEAISVDMTVRGNPFQALQLVAESYGFVPVYERGLWYFRPIREEQAKLYPRVYKLKHVHLNEVSATPGGGGGGRAQAAVSGGGLSGALPPKVDTEAFSSAPSKIIEDITTLLELDPADLALTEQPRAGSQAAAEPATQAAVNPVAALLGGRGADARAMLGLPPESQAARRQLKGRIIADPDQNTLFVIATRDHHDWISTYIDSIDSRRKLILLETRVVEVRKSDASNFGVDWSQTFGEAGYQLSLRDSETITTGTAAGGGSEISTGFNHYRWDGAILSGPELVATLHALKETSNARSLQHPSQVTVNNRQVVLRNVTQQPFKSGSSATTGGLSSTTTNQTEFIPIGTTISLLPRVIEGDNVELNILIQVSDLLGFQVIDGAQVPVTSARDYAGQAIVQSTNTLAIGGLETLGESRAQAKVPVLGDIPLLGYLFKRSQPENRSTKLIMFITATVLDDYTGGIQTYSEVQELLDKVDAEMGARPDKEEPRGQRRYLMD